MITKTIKTAMIASMLIALAFIPMQTNALAITPSEAEIVKDSTMLNFLNELVVDDGVTVKSKTVDSNVISVTSDVQTVSEDKYQVHITGTEDGNTTNDQTIIITKNSDGSVNMINERHGFNVDFYPSDETPQNEPTDVVSEFINLLLPQVFAGSGSSNGSGARIDLYDSDYRSDGTTVINLSDSYSGCLGLNQGDFSASVYTYTTNVNWDANLSYWDWCINNHTFDRLDVTHEGLSNKYTGTSQRTSSDKFNHSGGSGNFSVDINMYYGSW